MAITGMAQKGGKHGHALTLRMKAPACQARKIKAIRG
jgi:hypothetical protein